MINTLNKDVVLSTVLCYFSESGQCYVAESPIFIRCFGQGPSPEEAIKCFKEMFDQTYQVYQEGRLYGYGEGTVDMRRECSEPVQSHTMEYISSVAAILGCSKGEAIDYIVAFAKRARLPGPFGVGSSSVLDLITD